MESVAKSVQGPIKILFVSAWADPSTDPPTKLKTSLLGLGDIVVPGANVSVVVVVVVFVVVVVGVVVGANDGVNAVG